MIKKLFRKLVKIFGTGLTCPECGAEIKQATYVDYCTKCNWSQGY